MIRSIAGLLAVLCWGILPAAAQTLVDLRSQSQFVDFQNAQSTRPLKTGSSLPTTCNQGEMYFLTTAAAGANIYGCSAANTWTPQSAGGSGSTTIENTGTVVGIRPIVNLSTGTGVVQAISDTGTAISIQSSLDTSFVESRPSEQAGASLFCNSASGSATAYTCAMSPTLAAFTTGMVLHWKPDVSATGGPATLNVDSLGALSIKLPDGLTDPAPGDLVAGRILEIWYDGAVFRLLSARAPAGVLGEAQPTCSSNVQGRLWYVAGMTGVKDSLTVCAKDSTNAYAWRTLY